MWGSRCGRDIDIPESVDVVALANGAGLTIFRKEYSVSSERCVITFVAKLADGEKRMVGHGGEDMRTTSLMGKLGQDAVFWEVCGVCGGHGVTIGKFDMVAGCDRAFVNTRGVGANKVLGATCVGYAVRGCGGNCRKHIAG